MKICVVGSGYVGLVTGAGFAETGATVVCADIDQKKVESLRRGQIPIFEPGLDALIAKNVAAGRLSFTSEVGEAVSDVDIVFVAVGTPMSEDGSADLSAVDAVARTVAAFAKRSCLLVNKSTVPVGTSERVRQIVSKSSVSVHVVSNPEFLKEGDAISDFLRPDRIVIGVAPGDEFARATMGRLYHPLCLDRDRIIWMDPTSAELTKYVSNTMLAIRISFMNEVANLCEAVGADVHQVRVGVGADSRIGTKFLYAGPGYGGSCFPKDVNALVHTARSKGIPLKIAEQTEAVNRFQKEVLFNKVNRSLGGVAGKVVAVWGLAFKPRTDDIRESPAIALVEKLLSGGATVRVHDPEAMGNAKAYFELASGPQPVWCVDPYESAVGAEALVLVTEWREYQNPDFGRLREKMKTPRLFDGRNIWSEYGLRAQSFEYEGIGVRGS